MKTQKQAVLSFLIENLSITGSTCYTTTRINCKCASLNLHVIIRELGKSGVIFKQPKDFYNSETKTRFRRHYIDLKRTPKKVINEILKTKQP